MPTQDNYSITGLFSLIVSLATTIGLASQNGSTIEKVAVFDTIPVEHIQVQSIAELKRLFLANNYTWPPDEKPSNHLITSKLPESFANIKDPEEKKKLFVQTLLPIVQLENQRIAAERRLALLLLKDNQWPEDKRLANSVKNIAFQYGVRTKNAAVARQKLYQRIDQLPEPLVIAQAAIESGWGSSRFALEGNSLFGQWSFKQGSGLVPTKREDGLTHQVKAFEDLRASVRSYLLNINTNHAYRELRSTRTKMRSQGLAFDATRLAEGLHRYSQRNEDYVREIKSILRLPVFRAITSRDNLN